MSNAAGTPGWGETVRSANDALNFDFCPWANRWVYWLKHPLCIYVLALVSSALCGWFVNSAVLLFTLGLLVILALGVVWPWVTMRGLECQVNFERLRTSEHEPVTVRLTIRNRWPWPAWGLKLVQGFTHDSGLTGGVALARVAGWSTGEFQWSFRPTQRGVYPLTSPALETAFPFGLVRAVRPVTLNAKLVVWPERTSVRNLPTSTEVRHEGDRFLDRPGDQGDLLGTRPFRQGDSLRRVHWAQSARNQRLIVTEHQTPALCSIHLLVDVTAEHHDTRSLSTSSLERTLKVAASLGESLVREHASVICSVGSQRYLLGGSNQGLTRFLDALAEIPVQGIPRAQQGCPPKAIPGLEIVITSQSGMACRLQGKHPRASQRYMVAGAGSLHAAIEADCPSMRPWVDVSASREVLSGLDQAWRKGCHAV